MELLNTSLAGASTPATQPGLPGRQLEGLVDAWIERDRVQANLLGEVLRWVAILVDRIQDTFATPQRALMPVRPTASGGGQLRQVLYCIEGKICTFQGGPT